MPKTNKPATMAEAKKRYKSHTRGLLTTSFKQDCENAEWMEVDGFPALGRGDRRVLLHFRKDERGVFAAVGQPGAYLGQSSHAFGHDDR